MSGLYLTVDMADGAPRDTVLRTTRGGYPHITVAYAGSHLEHGELIEIAGQLMERMAMTAVTLDHAKVNSFTDGKGNQRHDVLVHLDEADAERIEAVRTELIRERFADTDLVEKIFMRAPHVTHEINAVKGDAEKRAQWLNDHVLPTCVKITGVTID